MAIETNRLGYDGSLTVDEYGNNKIIKTPEMIRNIVTWILFATPGSYPSIPHLGLNIRELLYNHYDELDQNQLANRIIAQCEELSYYFNKKELSVRKQKYYNRPAIYINISIAGNIYGANDDHSNNYTILAAIDEMNELFINVDNSPYKKKSKLPNETIVTTTNDKLQSVPLNIHI
jgi:hypothetical protein